MACKDHKGEINLSIVIQVICGGVEIVNRKAEDLVDSILSYRIFLTVICSVLSDFIRTDDVENKLEVAYQMLETVMEYGLERPLSPRDTLMRKQN